MLCSFVDKEIMPVRQQIDDDKDHVIVNKILQGLTDLGIQKAPFPSEYGGSDATATIAASIMHEELSRGDSGICTACNVTTWAWIHRCNEHKNGRVGHTACCPRYGNAMIFYRLPKYFQHIFFVFGKLIQKKYSIVS